MLSSLVLAIACGSSETPSGGEGTVARPAAERGVIAATDANFDDLVASAEGPVLVLFWAPWSGPDRIVLRYLARAARERPGLRVLEVDVDAAPKLATEYEVMAVPTALVLVDRRQRGRRVVGAHPRERWERDLGLDEVAPRQP